MAWSLLHRFKDNVGEVASGAQIDENFDQQREKIEAIEAAAPGAYSGLAAVVVNTETLESSTHSTNVVLTVTCEAASSLTVFVGGKEVTGCGSEGSSIQSISFVVGPGVKWKYTASKIAQVRKSVSQMPLPI